MSKKIYRSLFDSEDVYEVEELTDNPDVSTEGIATVKKDEGEITNKQLYDLMCEIRDLFKKPVTDNEPAIENEVAPLEQEIDKTAPVTTNDENETEKVGEEEKTSKAVTDSYSKFATGVVNKDKDSVVTAQVSFQNRYNKVANS